MIRITVVTAEHCEIVSQTLFCALDGMVAPMGIMALIGRFIGPAWGPSGADRTQVGPMLAPWTLLSGGVINDVFIGGFTLCYHGIAESWHLTKLFSTKKRRFPLNKINTESFNWYTRPPVKRSSDQLKPHCWHIHILYTRLYRCILQMSTFIY